MKVALVHYWLVGMRGGERVVETLCDLYPDADIFCLVLDREKISQKILRHQIHTSFLQKIGGKKHYRKMLPLTPFALEAFDLTSYDLVISSEAGPAKGVITRPDAVHICYCHSPMRYIWDLYPQYYKSSSRLTRLMMALTAPMLRQWDVTTAARVDNFVANSRYVAERIRKFYRRESTVINPPIDVSRFSIAETPGDFYLCAGQVTPYKRIDLAIAAFNKLGLPLVVIGSGVSREMRASAAPNITFLGAVDDAVMADHFRKCKALVFPGLEDFGLVPLEVMASGRPVIAYGAGGALETVIPGRTGILFAEQTVAALTEAVTGMERGSQGFRQAEMRQFAEAFDRVRFADRMKAYIGAAIAARGRVDEF